MYIVKIIEDDDYTYSFEVFESKQEAFEFIKGNADGVTFFELYEATKIEL